MKFLNYINWLLTRKETERALMQYCNLEYRGGDKYAAFNRLVLQNKVKVLNA